MGSKKIKKPGLFQKILILINFVLLLGGLSLIFAGYAIKQPEQLMHYMHKLFEQLEIGIPPQLIKIMGYLLRNGSSGIATGLLVTGVIVSVVSFAGCTGACCSRKLLKFYQACLLVVILILLFVFQYIIKHQIHYLPRIIGMVMAKYFSHYDVGFAKSLIDMTQTKGKCCGVFGVEMWRDNQGFQSKIGHLSYSGEYPVPLSCCRTMFRAPGCGLSNNETFQDENEEIFQKYDIKREEVHEWKTEYKQKEDDYKVRGWDNKFIDESEFTECAEWDENCDPMGGTDVELNLWKEDVDYTTYVEYQEILANGTALGNYTEYYKDHGTVKYDYDFGGIDLDGNVDEYYYMTTPLPTDEPTTTPFYNEETTFYDTTLATNTTDSVTIASNTTETTTAASNVTETTTTESTTANVTVSGRVALSIHRFKREERPEVRFTTAPGRRVLL